jgi:glycosyltransferase involved in cell wall biosynthesis
MFSVLVVSRLTRIKNVESAIRAVSLLDDVRLVIVGEGPDQSRLEKMAGPQVEFKGRVSDRELKGLYESCDAVLFPVLSEPFGLVPIEAMKYGKPVICSQEAGVAEVVKQAGAGIIINPLDIKQIADSILLLKKNSSLRKKLGNSGKKFVRGLSERCLRELERTLQNAATRGRCPNFNLASSLQSKSKSMIHRC